MSRTALRPILTALFLVSLAIPAPAQDRLGVVRADRAGGPHRSLERLRRCFWILDLTPQQQEEIRAIVEAAQPGLKADYEAVRGARQKLQSDLAAGAGECAIGADFLQLRAASEQLRLDLKTVADQVEAKLSPEQRAKLEGCLHAPRDDAAVADPLEGLE